MFLQPSRKSWVREKYWEKVIFRKEISQNKGNKESFYVKPNQFTPYQNNGGTVVALANKDYCVIASDTRFFNEFTVPSRFSTRVIKISSNILLATSGMQADLLALQYEVKKNVSFYQNKDERNFSIINCSFFLSSFLYSKRFFPFFTFNILSGLDDRGEGINFSFDAIGSFEKNHGSCKGKGEKLIQGLLDAQPLVSGIDMIKKSQQINNQVALAKNYFLRATQREITIGDGLQVFVLSRKGVLVENNILKTD